MTPDPRFREGPPRYFVPVCILTPFGFIGGPSGYKEFPADEVPVGPIVLNRKGVADEQERSDLQCR